jgi:uncharacterized membrane protein
MNPFYELAILSLVFLTLDGVWIGLIMRSHYNKVIKDIQGEDPDFQIIPAILCYLVLIGGLFYFVSQKIKKFDLVHILSLSVPFALCVFGTFDFTTATILKKWDLITAFTDLLWGVIVCTSSVMVAAYLKDSFKENPEEGNPVSHSS